MLHKQCALCEKNSSTLIIYRESFFHWKENLSFSSSSHLVNIKKFKFCLTFFFNSAAEDVDIDFWIFQ